MARAMWSGVIGFGMVSIPVKLYAATESARSGIALNLIHGKCKTKIKEVRWCPHCDQEVPWDDIERGYQYSKGKFVAVTDEDMEKLPVPSKNIIDVNSFVPSEEIDPIYFEKTYYLDPEKTAHRPFALFMRGLEDKDVIGIGRVTLRSKERLCALRISGDSLVLSTLLYPEEIREDPGVKRPGSKISDKELKMAHSLIDLLSKPFEPEEFKDEYGDAFKTLIKAKLKGLPLEEMAEPAAGGVVDLMEALKASVSRAKSGKAPSVTDAAAEAEEEVEEKPRKKRTRAASSRTTSKRKAATKSRKRGAA